MKYDIREGEHDQLIRVLDEEIAITNTALERIEEQAARRDDEDRSDLGDAYDVKYEHREDLRELRDLIDASRDGSGSVDVDEWQRSAIDQAREIIRQTEPAEDVEQLQHDAGAGDPQPLDRELTVQHGHDHVAVTRPPGPVNQDLIAGGDPGADHGLARGAHDERGGLILDETLCEVDRAVVVILRRRRVAALDRLRRDRQQNSRRGDHLVQNDTSHPAPPIPR